MLNDRWFDFFNSYLLNGYWGDEFKEMKVMFVLTRVVFAKIWKFHEKS